VPIVPAAILFDLNNGGDKASISATYESRSPYAELASTAIAGTAVDFDLGNVGAGFGATAGPLKGGLGSASLVFDDGPVVGALAAVNSHGSPVIPGTKLFWSWALEQDDELGGQRPELAAGQVAVDYRFAQASGRENTSLAVVATDAALSRVQARRVAIMAQDGIARAVRPAHTPLDGDTVFVLATGEGPTIATDDYGALAQLGTAAADCVARAVARGVYEAASVWGLPSYKSL